MEQYKLDAIKRWQAVLRQYFPGVVLGWNRGIEGEDIEWLDVYMVPDECMRDFIRFFLDDRRKYIRSDNLPDLDMMSYSVSETREHYPEIWRRAQSESSATAKTAPRKGRPKIRRAAAGKKAVGARS